MSPQITGGNRNRRWPYRCDECDRTIILTNLQRRTLSSGRITDQHEIGHMIARGEEVTIVTVTGRTHTYFPKREPESREAGR